MKMLYCSLRLLACLISSACAEEKLVEKTSERSELAENLILEDAGSKGFSGDSIKLSLAAPCSATMKLYSVAEGKSKLLQNSKPTLPSKNFEIGFMFRPAKPAGRVVDFIYYDHDQPTKDLGGVLRIEQPKPSLMVGSFPYSLSSMGAAQKSGETVVFYTSAASAEDDSSVDAAAKAMGKGYLITVTIDIQKAQ